MRYRKKSHPLGEVLFLDIKKEAFIIASLFKWWAILDSNQGPHPYQGCALAT